MGGATSPVGQVFTTTFMGQYMYSENAIDTYVQLTWNI